MSIRPHRIERAAFENFLLAHHERHTRFFKGQNRTYFAMPYGERYIWGVTAGIIRNLWERAYR